MNTIEFPKLGLAFNIDNVAFEIFGVPVYWYGIIIAAGFLLAVVLALRNSKKYGIEQDTILDVVLWAAPVAIVFSRLFYVAFTWEIFKDNPLDILDIRKGGLAIYGAIIGAFLTAIIFCRVKKISFLKLADFAMVYFPLAQAIGRWGNFVNQEAYGAHTELPWGMDGSEIVNGPVHPTFLYESLWDFCVFLVLLWFRKRKKNDGEVLYLYMILYGIGRAIVEPLRTDSLMLGEIRVNFLLAVLFAVVFTIILIVVRLRNRTPVEDAAGTSRYGELLKEIKKDDDDDIEYRESEEIEQDGANSEDQESADDEEFAEDEDFVDEEFAKDSESGKDEEPNDYLK
ncbi:MAG: prolipoprotein diacylglyceryl transferase [Eubacteriales bacterium]|nr:prolipoprotein diacylglyceryl transferase [Eubacteriales bacterium]